MKNAIKKKIIALLISISGPLISMLALLLIVSMVVNMITSFVNKIKSFFSGSLKTTIVEMADDVLLEGTGLSSETLKILIDKENSSYPNGIKELYIEYTEHNIEYDSETDEIIKYDTSGFLCYEYNPDPGSLFYQYRIPWQFLYAVGMVYELNNEMGDFNTQNGTFDIRRDTLSKICGLFNNEFEFYYDYFYQDKIYYYSSDFIMANGILCYDNRTVLSPKDNGAYSTISYKIPRTYIKSIKTLLYNYEWETDGIIEKGYYKFTKKTAGISDMLLNDLDVLGISISDLNLIIELMKMIPEGGELAEEISTLLYEHYSVTGTGAAYLSKNAGYDIDMGTAIVQEAKKYLGNPYVWGGTSLTKGADCSGFVQSLLNLFGIYVDRVSKDQAVNGVGIKVSETEFMPGDLLFYGKSNGGRIIVEHVALYIGEGQVIHAKGKKYGIVTESMYLSDGRKPLIARRVFGTNK